MSLFWAYYQSAGAGVSGSSALGHDALTTPANDATNTEYSWTHTPSGTPAVAIVAIVQNANSGADGVSGVTYGGQAMTRVPTDGFAQDTADEPGSVYLYTLISPPSGAQTVAVTKTSSTIDTVAASWTATSGGTPEIASSDSEDEGFAGSSFTLSAGGKSAIGYTVIFSGHGATTEVSTVGDTSEDGSHDFGSQVALFGRTPVSTDAHSIGWTQSFNDGAHSAVLIKDPGGAAPAPSDQEATYAAAVLALSPVAYYRMKEGSGSTMVDASSTGNDGTYSGGPTLGVSGPFDGATAVTFDGSTQWASAPNDVALDFGAAEDFSIVAWVKTANWSDGLHYIVGRNGNGNYDAYELRSTTLDRISSRLSDAAETVTTEAISTGTPDMDDDSWHMVAATFDRSGNVTFYVDNSADGTTDISALDHALDNAGALYISRRQASSFFWNGEICQVAVFDSLLSSGDIGDLWTAAGN